MSYLLDTCVISELIKVRPAAGVVNWIANTNESSMFISVLTIGEIHKGIVKLADSEKKRTLQDWLDNELHQRFDGRILPISLEVARVWGEIQGSAQKEGAIMPTIGSLIAATGIAHDMTVVTRNASDMKRSGARIHDPWPSP